MQARASFTDSLTSVFGVTQNQVQTCTSERCLPARASPVLRRSGTVVVAHLTDQIGWPMRPSEISAASSTSAPRTAASQIGSWCGAEGRTLELAPVQLVVAALEVLELACVAL